MRCLSCDSLSGYTFEISNPSRVTSSELESSFLGNTSNVSFSSLLGVVLRCRYCPEKLCSCDFSPYNEVNILCEILAQSTIIIYVVHLGGPFLINILPYFEDILEFFLRLLRM